MSGEFPRPRPKIFCEATTIVEEFVTEVTEVVSPFAYVSVSTPEFASGNVPSIKVTTSPFCEIVPLSVECKFKLSKALGTPTTSNALPNDST